MAITDRIRFFREVAGEGTPAPAAAPAPTSETPADPAPAVDPAPAPAPEPGAPLVGKAPDGSTSPEPAPAFTPLTAEEITASIPEGFEATPEQITELETLMSNSTDTQSLFKNMMALHATQMQSAAEQVVNDFSAQMQTWADEVRNAPEYSGGKLEPVLARANELAEKFGGPGFLELLGATGASNSIHTVKFFDALSKALPSEATPTSGQPAVPAKSRAEIMFPSSAKGA